MDESPDKAEDAARAAAPILSLSAVPCSTGGQLILNGSGGFLAASQPLLLNGNSLISGAGAGVIINGLSLGDCQTVTLSPVAASAPLMLNGAQVIAKPDVGTSVEEREASAMEAKASGHSASNPCLPPQLKTEDDFIGVPELESSSQKVSSSSSSSLSPSSPTLPSPTSLPSLVLTQHSQESLALPAAMSSAGVMMARSAGPLSSQQGEYVVFATASSQVNPSSPMVSPSSVTPQVFSLPQVVPSIQGIPVSQLVQHSSGAPVSQCPQLVPVSPLTAAAPQFQSLQTVTADSRLAQQQHGPPEGNNQLPHQMTRPHEGHAVNSTPGKVQAPQVISISSPTQIVPFPQSKATAATQLVPLSVPQLVPASSSMPTSSAGPFPQVVPAGPLSAAASAAVPLQILTSAPAAAPVSQGPLRINQLRPIQSVASPASVAPGVRLLNSGIIQLPSAPAGTLTK